MIIKCAEKFPAKETFQLCSQVFSLQERSLETFALI